MSAMANVPIKAKQIYYIMFCIPKNVILFIFFEQKKILNKKTFVKKIQGTHNMHNFSHMTIFPKAHGT